jgi:hypothetical protein
MRVMVEVNMVTWGVQVQLALAIRVHLDEVAAVAIMAELHPQHQAF